MKYFSGLIFLAIMTYLVWPYVHLYQLNDAVINNDQVAFEKLLDIEAVRKVYKENIEWKTSQLGPQEKNVFSDLMRQGANFFGNTAVDTMINANWILGRLQMTLQDWYWRVTAIYE
jgi:hypothetical protein